MPDGPQPQILIAALQHEEPLPRQARPIDGPCCAQNTNVHCIFVKLAFEQSTASGEDRRRRPGERTSVRRQAAQLPAGLGALHDHRRSDGGAQHDYFAGARGPAGQQI